MTAEANVEPSRKRLKFRSYRPVDEKLAEKRVSLLNHQSLLVPKVVKFCIFPCYVQRVIPDPTEDSQLKTITLS